MDNSVSVIIPAFNEADRIADVLEAVASVTWLDEVIVIDDSSLDDTALKAKEYSVKVIELAKNVGKGGALQAGIDESLGDILIFIDADLVGLREDHIATLVSPLLEDEKVMMTVGKFSKGRLTTNLSQRITPILNGQRGLRRNFADRLPDLTDYRFGVEIFLSRYAASRDIETEDVVLEGLSQVLKEEKSGILKGTIERYKMYGQLIKTLKDTGK